jgi:hypothetical protein
MIKHIMIVLYCFLYLFDETTLNFQIYNFR